MVSPFCVFMFLISFSSDESYVVRDANIMLYLISSILSSTGICIGSRHLPMFIIRFLVYCRILHFKPIRRLPTDGTCM